MVTKIWSNSQKILSRQQSSILSAAAVITGSSMLSAILGLLRNRLLISRFFGTYLMQQQLDAYWVAFRLPELVFQLLVIGSLSAAFIPVYSTYKHKNPKSANIIASSLINIVLLIFVLASGLIFVFAEDFNRLITSVNFTNDQIRLAASLSRVMILAQFFFAISNFLTGIIQSHQRFLVPALSPLAYNAGIIVGILVLSPMIGIYGPAVGVVIGAFLHLLLQLPLAKSLGFSYVPTIAYKHPGVREMIKLIPPRTLAISVSQLELFASVYFATALSAGSLTILNLAQQLMTAPTRIFSVPLGQASLPFLSQQVAEGQMDKFKKTLISSLHHVLFLAFPASMLLLILRIPLVRLAYGSRVFPWSATLLTGKAVAILSLALFAQGAIHILVRAFYAIHNTKLPFVVALFSVAVNILLSYLSVFYYKLGVLGLSAAVLVSTVIHFLILFVLLIRRLEGLNFQLLIATPTKILMATGVMGLFLWLPMRLLDEFVFDTTRTLPLLMLTSIVGLIGGGMYLSIAKLLKIPEVDSYSKLLKKLGNWRLALKAQAEVLEQPSHTQEVKPL